MKTVQIKIENKIFDVKLEEDEFASFLEQEIKNVNMKTVKDLLSSYIKKSYEVYVAEKKLKKALER